MNDLRSVFNMTRSVNCLDQGFSNFMMARTPKYDEPYTRDPHTKIYIIFCVR